MEIPSPAVECMQSPIFLQRERIPGKRLIFQDARVKMKLVAMMKLQNWMLMKSRISAADISMKNCRHHRINPPPSHRSRFILQSRARSSNPCKEQQTRIFQSKSPHAFSPLRINYSCSHAAQHCYFSCFNWQIFFLFVRLSLDTRKGGKKPFRFPCNSSTIS